MHERCICGKMLTEGAQPRSLTLKREGASLAEAPASLINITNTSALVRYNAATFANTLTPYTNHRTREGHSHTLVFGTRVSARTNRSLFFDTSPPLSTPAPNPSSDRRLSEPHSPRFGRESPRPFLRNPAQAPWQTVYPEGRCHRTFRNLSISPTFPIHTHIANTIWQHCSHRLQATTHRFTPTTASSQVSTHYFRPRLATA